MTAFYGTPDTTNSRYRVASYGASTAANAAGSLEILPGQVQRFVPPASNTAWRLTPGGAATDAVDLNTNTNTWAFNNGLEVRGYSDAYTTATYRLGGATGHLGFEVPGGKSLSVAAGGGAGSSPPAPTLLASSCDMAGQVSMGTGTAPTTGVQCTVTYGTAFGQGPLVVVCAANAATAALHPYVSGSVAGTFSISFVSAPAASQAAGIYVVNYHVIARGA